MTLDQPQSYWNSVFLFGSLKYLWVSRVQAVEKQFLARVAATGNSQVHWMLNPRTSCTKTLAFPWRFAMRCHGSERCAQRRASYGLPLTALGGALFGTSIGYCRFGSLRPPNPIRLGTTLWIGRLQQGSLRCETCISSGFHVGFQKTKSDACLQLPLFSGQDGLLVMSNMIIICKISQCQLINHDASKWFLPHVCIVMAVHSYKWDEISHTTEVI